MTYLSASNKQQAIEAAKMFFSETQYSAPMLFEVFTAGDDENKALEMIRSIANHENMKEFTQMPVGNSQHGTVARLRRLCSGQKQFVKKLLRR